MITSSIVLVFIVAALLELDTTYAFQTLLSRPILAGPLLGLITGDVMAGIQVGIFAELLFSDISPLGGIIPPSGVVAVTLSIVLYRLGVELYFGFFLGVVAAVCYSLLDIWLRKTRFTWLVFVEKKITKHPADIKQTIFTFLFLSFVMTFIFLSVITWLSAQFAFAIFPYLTTRIHFAFQLAYIAIPWIGLASLISAFRLKTR